MNNFIMLPNKLVWDSEGKNNTYLKLYGEKVVHIFTYLEGMQNRFGTTTFNLQHMIESCGLKTRRGAKNSNEQFKNMLIDLQEKGIIETDDNLQEAKINTHIECIFHMPIEKNGDFNIAFFNIPVDKYLEIIDNYEGKLNRLTLLKVYYYVNARITRRENIITDEGQKLNVNDIQLLGGKANCFYDSYLNICSDLNMAENTWKEYITELKKIGLIFYANIGNVQKDRKIYTANNVYCIEENELKEALKQSELYYKDEGYKIVKNSKKNVKQAIGLQGKIKQEKNKNNDTTELESTLETIKGIEEEIEEIKIIDFTEKSIEKQEVITNNIVLSAEEVADAVF